MDELAPIPLQDDLNYLIHSRAESLLPRLASESVQLIYIDPPFNTGKVQRRQSLATMQDPLGDRTGFGGHRYSTTIGASKSYVDRFDDYLEFLAPLLDEARRILRSDGTLYFHIDPRESHYCKVLLDKIFGRTSFLNEIIWAYDYGGRAKDRWPAKHDTILVYVKSPKGHYFNREAVDRIPYMAPGLVTPEKRERGKFPTDVWWHTIVPTSGKEKTGYPTQKPLGILRRIIAASSEPGETVLDFFGGSGTTGMAASLLGRRYLLGDQSATAIATMSERFAADPPKLLTIV